MFKIVSKKEWIKTKSLVDSLRESLIEHEQQISDLLEKIQKSIESEDKNSVVIEIEDDLETLRPIVKYKAGIRETMVQRGIISDASAEGNFNIQLALMTIADEGLRQILESFEKDISDD